MHPGQSTAESSPQQSNVPAAAWLNPQLISHRIHHLSALPLTSQAVAEMLPQAESRQPSRGRCLFFYFAFPDSPGMISRKATVLAIKVTLWGGHYITVLPRTVFMTSCSLQQSWRGSGKGGRKEPLPHRPAGWYPAMPALIRVADCPFLLPFHKRSICLAWTSTLWIETLSFIGTL